MPPPLCRSLRTPAAACETSAQGPVSPTRSKRLDLPARTKYIGQLAGALLADLDKWEVRGIFGRFIRHFRATAVLRRMHDDVSKKSIRRTGATLIPLPVAAEGLGEGHATLLTAHA